MNVSFLNFCFLLNFLLFVILGNSVKRKFKEKEQTRRNQSG